jgi:protease-4
MDARRVAWMTWMLSLTVLAGAGCSPTGGIKMTLVPADKTLKEETVIREGLFAPKIAVVDISGMLLDQQIKGLLTEGENPVSFTQEQLKKAEDDSAVKAVILRINSPGGTVTASQIIHDEVTRFKTKSKKPVVTMMMDMAASGGYYVACASDRLFAYPTTVTGSIGVIMQLFSLQGSLEAIRMKTYAIKSGAFKDAGSPLRDLTPPEREYFDKIVMEFFSRFLEVVEKGRPGLSPEKIKALADGKVCTGQDALANGLVDEVGTVYTAIDYLKTKTNHKKMNVVVYHRPQEWKPNIYAAGPGPTPQAAQAGPLPIDLGQMNDALRPKFLYLWAPGLAQ